MVHLLGYGRGQVTPCKFKEKAIIFVDSLRIRFVLLVVMDMSLHTFAHHGMLLEALNPRHVSIMEEKMVFDMSLMLIVFLIFAVKICARFHI